MKNLLFIFVVILSTTGFSEIEIELVTGSKFKGNVTKTNKKFVIVDTAIGELKLTRAMLSPECQRTLRIQTASNVSKEKPEVNVKVTYKEKILEREKESGRRGRKRQLERKAGVIIVFFNDLPRGKSFSGYVEYKFKAEATAKNRGEIIDFDKGIKRFEIEANQMDPNVEIESKSITHISAKRTGNKIGERGMKLKGYSVKVYLDGHLVYEGEK